AGTGDGPPPTPWQAGRPSRPGRVGTVPRTGPDAAPTALRIDRLVSAHDVTVGHDEYPRQYTLPPPADVHHVEPLALEDDLPNGLLAVVALALQPAARIGRK